MTIAAIKKQLHHFIDNADDNKLKAIHLLLQNERGTSTYTNEELDKFYSVLNDYEAGAMKVFPVEQIHNDIRARITRR